MAAEDAAEIATLEASIQRFFTTGKWIATSSGAIGAVLVGTLTFAGLEKLPMTYRVLALASFLLAILGVLIAVFATAELLAPNKPDFHEALAIPEIRDKLNSSRTYLLGFTVEEIETEYERLAEEATRPHFDAQEAKADGEYEQASLHLAKARRAELLLKTVNPAVDWVKTFSLHHTVKQKFFEEVKPQLAYGATIAAIGIALFAFFMSNPSVAEEEVVPMKQFSVAVKGSSDELVVEADDFEAGDTWVVFTRLEEGGVTRNVFTIRSDAVVSVAVADSNS